MANLPARRYNRADSERLELNVKSVEAMMAKYHLTTLDILVGLRYSTPKERWEEQAELARELCEQYEVYKGVEPEAIQSRYGS